MSQKAELEITIRGNQAVQEANKIKRGITDIGTKGQSTAAQIDGSTTKMSTSLGKISTASVRASTSITELGTKSQVAAGVVDSASGKMSSSLSRVGIAGKTAASVTTIGMTKAASGIALVSGAAVTAQANITRIGTTAQAAGAQVSGSMGKAAGSLGAAGAAGQQAGIGFGAGALGIAALGTSAATTFTGMSNLNKAQLKVNKSQQKIEKSTVGLARANDLLSSTTLAITRFQNQINKLQGEGKESTDAYSIAVANLELQQQKLVTAQDDLRVKTADIKIAMDDAAQAADDLQDTYINMSVSIGNTILISLFVLSTLLPQSAKRMIALGAASLKTRVALLLTNKAVTASIFSLSKFRLATIGATFGARGLAIGIKGVFIAMGPIGFAIIGITTAFTLWETNAFGVRDALVELWEWLKKILPVLALLESAVRSVFPEEVVEDIEDVTLATQEATEAFDMAGNAAMGAAGGVGQLTVSLGGATNEFGNTINAVLAFNRQLRGKGLEELESSFELLIGNMKFANQQFEEFPERMNLALAEVSPALRGIADKWDLAWGPGAFQKRINEMLKFGDITQKEFDQITAAIEKAGKGLDDFKKKQDKTALTLEELNELRLKAKLNVPAGFIAGLEAAGFGGEIIGAFREAGKPSARNAATLAAEDVNKNKLKTGGVRVPGIPLDQPGAVIGGFTSAAKFRFANKEASRILRREQFEFAQLFGGVTRRAVPGILRIIEEVGLTLPRVTARTGFGAFSGIFETAKTILVERKITEEKARIVEEKRLSNLVALSGFTIAEILELETTQTGINDLMGIIDYRKRRMLVSSSVN